MTLLALSVWWKRIRHFEFCFVSAVGLAIAAFFASVIDRYQPATSWWPYRTLAIGTTFVTAVQIGILWWRESQQGYRQQRRGNWLIVTPILLSGVVALLFAVRGSVVDTTHPWTYLLLLVGDQD